MMPNDKKYIALDSSIKKESGLFDKNIFYKLKDIDSFYLENDNFLQECESIFLPLAVFVGVIGACCFAPHENMYLIAKFGLWILGIVLIVISYLLIDRVKIFSIFNLKTNSIYKETRFNSKVIYRSRPIKLSDIIMFGVDHQRGHGGFQESKHTRKKVDYYLFLASLITGKSYIREEETEKFKKESKIDGLIEKQLLLT